MSSSPTPRPRAALHRSALRLRRRLLPIVQTAVAAVLAWLLADALLPADRPAFASIAAVVAVGATFEQRRERAVELVLGVVTGLTVADAIVSLIGAGPLQMGVMVVLAMCAATVLGGGNLLVSEAAVSAILLITLEPGTGDGFSPDRMLEAAIGGAVALGVSSLLFPPDPALLVGRAVQGVFDDLGRTLGAVAGAVEEGDAPAAERALAGARTIDARIHAVDDALALGRETARLAPPRRAALAVLERYARTLAHLDFAVRNTRVLARHAVRHARAGRPAPPGLAQAIRDLGEAVWQLAAAYDHPASAADARRLARAAALDATTLVDGRPDLALVELVAQLRSTAVDVIRAAELVADAVPPEHRPTEELLAASTPA